MTYDDNYYPEDLEQGEEGVICPICGATVNNNPSNAVFSVDHIDSDFRVRTLEDDILDDWLIMCPTCYFVAHDFTVPLRRENEIRAYVQSVDYTSMFSDNSPTTLELFSIYLVLLTLQERDPYSRADCHLRLAWLYEDEGDAEHRDLQRRKAAELFRSALDEGLEDVRQRGIIHYLISDIHRRLGEFDKAEKALYDMDRKEKTLKHLHEFQSKLVADRNPGPAALPGDSHYEL